MKGLDHNSLCGKYQDRKVPGQAFFEREKSAWTGSARAGLYEQMPEKEVSGITGSPWTKSVWTGSAWSANA